MLRDLACDDGAAEVEDGQASAKHQHEAASSPKGSRRPRSGFTSRDSWKRTMCVRYFILICFNTVQICLSCNKQIGEMEHFILLPPC
jgi:hypothetical protein